MWFMVFAMSWMSSKEWLRWSRLLHVEEDLLHSVMRMCTEVRQTEWVCASKRCRRACATSPHLAVVMCIQCFWMRYARLGIYGPGTVRATTDSAMLLFCRLAFCRPGMPCFMYLQPNNAIRVLVGGSMSVFWEFAFQLWVILMVGCALVMSFFAEGLRLDVCVVTLCRNGYDLGASGKSTDGRVHGNACVFNDPNFGCRTDSPRILACGRRLQCRIVVCACENQKSRPSLFVHTCEKEFARCYVPPGSAFFAVCGNASARYVRGCDASMHEVILMAEGSPSIFLSIHDLFW